ncbi:MAG TPA: aldehyde dehydrogenase [Pseudonocardia sp.]|nr:aldehyde dehydrogenase [Pseudonocardia sp.]
MQIPHENELFIAGRWVPPATSRTAEVVSPADGRVLRTLPLPSVADAEAAVEGARRAFPAWSALSLEERRDHVARFCAALDARVDEINAAWALEAGMPLRDGKELTAAASELWNHALELAKSLELSEVRESFMGPVEIRREPLGPTVAIVAFNGPHMQTALAVVPGLIVGNPFVIKLPPLNRMLGYFIADAAAEADLPEGVLSVLAGDADVSEYLVGHPDVAAVHFTGGNEVGSAIMRACADRVAHVTLELGGKSAAIVAADADLDQVVPALVGSLAQYSGQICVAMTRILVAREIHDELVRRLAAGFAALTIGDPSDPETEWGPLAGERFRERAEGYIARAVAAGATVAYGGSRPAGHDHGWYLEPTLLTGVTNDMEVAQNEIFGPVFCVIPFDELDEAVAIANDSRYGLAGSVFTRDTDVARDVARRVRTGVFAINATFPRLTGPFGGMKQSGFGREGGIEGFWELTSTKSIAL